MASTARVTTWSSGDTLTAAALNGEFNAMLNGGINSISNANIASDAAIATSKINVTFPSGTIVGSSDTQTLTNKTLTSPVINVGSDAQGDLYYRNSSGVFARLAAGTSGYFLKTNGASANPEWANGGTGDGWVSTSDSWTYASASTVTVPSGAASLYQKGDRVKFTQTTVKYFVIVSVADTVLTFAVNTDYTVANAAISAISYSHQKNPIGYPSYFNYTPTITKPTGLTATVGLNHAIYQVEGKFIHLSIMWTQSVTSGSVSGTNWSVTLPVSAASISSARWLGAGVIERTNVGYSLILAYSDVTDVELRNYANAAFATGDNEFDIDIWYPI
ncbi:MAG: hypothetical protein AAB922_02145 [Patescibacteria group bacterium]